MRLIYENYTASYKSFQGTPRKFQEISSISRSCRHPVLDKKYVSNGRKKYFDLGLHQTTKMAVNCA